MNACKIWEDRLLDYALGDTERPGVESHSKICPNCSAALDRLHERQEQIETGLRQLVGGAQLSPGFRARVLAVSETRPTVFSSHGCYKRKVLRNMTIALGGAVDQHRFVTRPGSPAFQQATSSISSGPWFFTEFTNGDTG